MRFSILAYLSIGLMVGLSGCVEQEVVEVPPPAPLTDQAVGYYCNMTMTEHQGPKGQIRLKSRKDPVWFSSVRDTVAFTMLPEEPKDIQAVYVTDMSNEASWRDPENSTWIAAKTAHYVMGSRKNGGMGAPEPVPFATKEAAQIFSRQYGGNIVAFSDIPESSILGPVELSNNPQIKEPGR